MNKLEKALYTAGCAFTGLATLTGAALAEGEFDEFVPIVEINASDGDVGFHVLLDGDPWKVARVFDPDNNLLLRIRAKSSLRDQGATEVFMESSEPPCWFDDEDEDADEDDILTVDDFIERFPAGTYEARGKSLENEFMKTEGELTHKLPAAPETDIMITGDKVEISWDTGTDLGQCDYSNSIPDPAGVEVVRWEIVVEVNEDELPGGELPEGVPDSVFSIQLPADVKSVVVPPEYIDTYLDLGINQFKYEVGAREESGNQTFTEEEFEIE